MEQYAYTPYGQIVARDDLTAPGDPATPQNRIGHQGLFFDRYNFPTNPLTDSPFDTAALGLYYNRNRFYSPTIGRYLRNDPNASGAPLIMANGFHGSAPFPAFDTFEALSLYADGMNLFTSLGNNPVMFNDPSGLIVGRLTDTLVAVTFAYAIGLDAVIVSQLEDGPASSNIDAAIRVLPFMLSGALAGAITGSSAIAGGVTGAGTGLGFAAGFAIGAAYDVGFSIVGAGIRAGLGSSAAGLGKRLLGRVLRFRGGTNRALFQIGRKIEKDMVKRGWTRAQIQEAMTSGRQVRAINKANGNPATRYVHPTTGKSVVIDDITNDVVQVGGSGFQFGPNSGDVP